MTDTLETYLAESLPEIPGDYVRLQRTALREFARLRPESAGPAQAQVESYYKIAQKAIDDETADAKTDIQNNFDRQKKNYQEDHQSRVEEISQRYEWQLGELNRRIEREKSDLNSNLDTAENESKQKCEYDILTAETVADGTAKKIKQQRHQFVNSIPGRRRRLDERYHQAENIIVKYRQKIPVETEPASPEDNNLPNPESILKQHEQDLENDLQELTAMKIPGLFMGIRPVVLPLGLGVGVAGILYVLIVLEVLSLPAVPATVVAFLATIAALVLLGRLLWAKAKAKVSETWRSIRQSYLTAQHALEAYHQKGLDHFRQLQQKALETRDRDIEKAQSHYDKVSGILEDKRRAGLEKLDADYQVGLAQYQKQRDEDLQQAEADFQAKQTELEKEHRQALDDLMQRTTDKVHNLQERYESARNRLHRRWRESIDCLKQFLAANARLHPDLFRDWQDHSWRQWQPPHEPVEGFRFGRIDLDWNALLPAVRELEVFDVDSPVTVPAVLTFPQRGSLLVQTRRQGRLEAISLLRAVMLRLFASIPPGRVRFTILDPVSLGENFAGFMHVADYVESLVGGRIWTDAAQIQQQLVDLTHHMENVIQKYLRNEFNTIEDYNRQAGELAEPYRFLVIADFPHNFNEEAVRQLSSIVNSGPRCGVYTLIAYDARQDMPPGVDIEDIASKSIYLKFDEDRFVWQDEVYRQFQLLADAPPAEERLTDIMQKVGHAAIDTTRVELPFEKIAPSDGDFWSRSSARDVDVPVGRMGANRLQHLIMGHGVAQHGLIAGKTGSGKSTLLHVIITNLALWYSPREIELYLIDFKKGVEFKTYVTHHLPHARTIAIESDREFGLSILQRLDAEMTRRGNLFRQAGVQDIAAYRESTGEDLPRILLLVDEFQVFFTEDDKLSQDAAIYMEQLVRQGRAFGIHVILGSQTLGGSSNLARSTIGQMAIRIALQCSEMDSQVILDDDNTAARLLTRPGEAIYNDAGGMVVGNSPFQISWLSEAQRDGYLTKINELREQQNIETPPPIVFEGNIPADITGNHLLRQHLATPAQDTPVAATAWLGEPVAIKEPTGATFQPLSGANLMIVGQREEAALGIMAAALISLAAQHTPKSGRFYLLDGSTPDSPTAGKLLELAMSLPHNCNMTDYRDVEEVMAHIHQEMQTRLNSSRRKAQTAVFILIYGIQRYRMLRRSEDDFGLSSLGDDDRGPKTDKLFAEILRDGPAVGIHTILWSDTLTSLERTFDRSTMREFDNRVLFQMSAADSSNLIDAPLANRLGFHRAIFYSEEQGLIEKFRPYALPPTDWLAGAWQRNRS